jgi:hypothetical protein
MQPYLVSIFFRKKVQVFFALVFFLVISLHTLHFDHDHQKEFFGDDIQAIMHGSDKKYVFVLDVPIFNISPSVLPAGFLIFYFFSIFFVTFFRRIFDPFREALRRGIIHSKIYE